MLVLLLLRNQYQVSVPDTEPVINRIYSQHSMGKKGIIFNLFRMLIIICMPVLVCIKNNYMY